MNKNKTGVHYSNIEYIKSDNATICLLECIIDYEKVRQMFGLNDENRNQFMNFLDSIHVTLEDEGLVYTVKGVTRYDNENPFSEVAGERLALSKAQFKAFDKANKIYYTLGELWQNMGYKLSTLIHGTYHVAEHCNEHVNELINATR